MEGQSGQKEHLLILINDFLILIHHFVISINDLLILINDFLILKGKCTIGITCAKRVVPYGMC